MIGRPRRKHQRIVPHLPANRPGWRVTFSHPKTGERTTKSLSTRDEMEAKAIALDLEWLVNTPALWDLEATDERLAGLHARAVEVFFGWPPEELQAVVTVKAGVRPPRIIRPGFERIVRTINGFEFEFTLDDYDRERKARAKAEQDGARLRRKLADHEEENAKLRRRLNLHCRVSLGDAAKEYGAYYKTGHAPVTVQQALAAVADFVAFVGGSKGLGKVKAADVDAFLGQMKNKRFRRGQKKGRRSKAEESVSQVTKAKTKRYLRTFFNWAHRRFDLAENPMDKTQPIPGVARNPEHILAIRRYADFQSYLKSLEPWPYWRAWVAVACLAGPRWAEQAWLKVDGVYLDNGYIRVASRASGRKIEGTKTGLERNVPIERKVLLPILEQYLNEHDGKTPWLFPATGVSRRARAKCEGRWGHGAQFLRRWKAIEKLAKDGAGAERPYWGYGPREWRHCAGTAMGHSGLSSLQISQWLGNSEDLCRRHYIAPVNAKCWPLKWG